MRHMFCALALFALSTLSFPAEVYPPGRTPVPPPTDPEDPPSTAKAFLETLSLASDENIKLFLPPFHPGRIVWYVESAGRDPSSLSRGPRALYFSSDGASTTQVRVVYSENPFENIITIPLSLSPLDLDGDSQLLGRAISADVVFRKDAPIETLRASLEAAFAEKFVTPVKLTFKESERDTCTVSGSYQYRRLPSPIHSPYGSVVTFDPSPDAPPDTNDVPPFGSFDSLLARLRGAIGFPLVSKIENPPRGNIFWFDSPRLTALTKGGSEPLPPDQLEKVLSHVSAQTALTFTREKLKIRRLFVTLDNSPAPDRPVDFPAHVAPP